VHTESAVRSVTTHVERNNRAEALVLASCGFVSWMAPQAGMERLM